jgi:hypothetical protein
MPYIDPKALTLMVLSAASGTIQDGESLLVLAGVQSFSSNGPCKRRVVTQGSEENEGSQTRENDFTIWDVLSNACAPSSYCEPSGWEMYHSNPLSQMSSPDFYTNDYFDDTRDNKDHFLQRAREVISSGSCDTSPRDGPPI